MYNRFIIGAGIYGLYSAITLAIQGLSVLVIDADEAPFLRGSYINQARVHNGYHYPRSYSTASKSAKYFQRFIDDYNDCILFDFEQIYAISAHFSWTNGAQFIKFCRNVNVRCDEIVEISRFFNSNAVEKAFYTTEYTFDAKLIAEKMYKKAISLGVNFKFCAYPTKFEIIDDNYKITLMNGETITVPWVLNAAYAGINAIHKLASFEPLNLKYELCEVILVKVSDNVKNTGLTVMDGPFFSLMPFGKSGYHSLTTVSRTPHMTSYELLPSFSCQSDDCTPLFTKNCNTCAAKPQSAFVEMKQIAKKYLNPNIEMEYVKSLFTLKPLLKASEIDDSRPTLVRQYSYKPQFYTVFSGKINTIYDLDGILK